MDFGEVVLVRFPFTNQVEFKQRPAVVVSNELYSSLRQDVVIMAITSQINAKLRPGDVLIQDWQAANLLKPSAVKPLFATIEQKLIIRSMGRLQQKDEIALRSTIRVILS